MFDWRQDSKCEIVGCNRIATFHIKTKEDEDFFNLCFEHANLGKNQQFKNMFLKTLH